MVNLLTPDVVGSFPEVWFKQLSGSKEAMGLDSKRLFEGLPLEEIISQMDQAEVETALLHAIDLGHWQIRIPVEAGAQSVSRLQVTFREVFLSEDYLMVVRGKIEGGTQFGTQKCVAPSGEAANAADTVCILLSNFVSIATTGA